MTTESGKDIDISKIKDLYDDDEILEEMDAADNIIHEDDEED